MRNALLAAVAAHVLIVFSVAFSGDPAKGSSSQIEVTLAVSPSLAAQTEAKHVAQSDQQGGGEKGETDTLTSRDRALPVQSVTQQPSAPRQRASETSASSELLTTVAAAQRVVSDNQQEETRRENLTQGINPEVDRLNRQLASLQAELDDQNLQSTTSDRVRRITSVSARQSADAAYLLDWRRRLEAVGNKYYPEASIRYGLYGDLRLLVVINKDGSLQNIRILKSSGYAVLDEAAIKIVRMAAPYAPFPPELAATTDTLEIVRTWQFQQDALGSE